MNTPTFDEIYENLFPQVYRFVRLRVPSSDVDDVTAEVMAKVWRAFSGFRGENPKAWALRIAYNQIADYYRAHKRSPSAIPLIEVENGVDASEDWLTFLTVSQALDKLSPTHLAVLQLRLVEGFSSAETAGILGTTQQAVDSLLYRAKKRFRKAYESATAGGGQP